MPLLDIFSLEQLPTIPYTQIQNVTADRLLGRLTTSGSIQELTAAQVRTLLNVSDGATNFIHPTYTTRSIDTTGAQVIDVFTSDTSGSVTNITTRTMTLADLGYTGATNADNYSSWLLAASGTAGTATIGSGNTVTLSAGTGMTVTRATNTVTFATTITQYTDALARAAISLTTTGNSGVATYTTASGVLNIPNYTLAGLGGFANPMTTLGDIIYGGASGVATRLAGNTTTTRQFLAQTGTGTISAIPAWTTIAGSDVTGAALTSTNDTNVTITLGGTPATSLLRAASITLGWSGQLSVGRGGTGASTLTGVLIGNGTSAVTAVAGTASQLLRRNAGNTAYEFFTHDFVNQAGARSSVSLTTTGNSGASTYSSATGVFNIPNYTLAGLGGQAQLNGTGFVKVTGTTVSYDNSTYYLASNPSGYTSNTGTVTSVSGTGGYGGLTLSGTVTTSGNITLGGTPSGTWPIASAAVISGEISDLNSAWTLPGSSIPNGLYVYRYSNTATNKPVAINNANWLMNIYSHPTGGTASYGHQLAAADADTIYSRTVTNGNFGAWRALLNTANATLQVITDIGNATTNPITVARLTINGNSTWFTIGSTGAVTNYGTFLRSDGTTAGAYIGFDNGGILGGGDGTAFGIRSQADLILMSGGAQRVRVFSNGNVFIGDTPSDSGDRLRVVGGNVRLDSVTNATGDIVTIDANSVLRRRTAAQLRLDIGAPLRVYNGAYSGAGSYVAHTGTGGTTFFNLYNFVYAYYTSSYKLNNIHQWSIRGEVTFVSSFPTFTFTTATNQANSVNFSGVAGGSYRYEIEVITVVRDNVTLKVTMTVKLFNDTNVWQRVTTYDRTVTNMSTTQLDAMVQCQFSASNASNFINTHKLVVIESPSLISDNYLNG